MKIQSFFPVMILVLSFSISVFSQRPATKKNARPSSDDSGSASVSNSKPQKALPVYFYEFEKPEFLISKVLIEHDETGLGKITFNKKDFGENISDPLALSASTLERIKDLWRTIDFLNSTEKFQSKERDYAHLGTIKLRMKKDEKERTEEFNWSENLSVKAISDEYRKIGNQVIWLIDFEVARKNQPLRTPRMIRGLDSKLRRNAISDPVQMVPYLKALSNDESVPLISRNHAGRLVKRIESEAKKRDEPSPEDDQ